MSPSLSVLFLLFRRSDEFWQAAKVQGHGQGIAEDHSRRVEEAAVEIALGVYFSKNLTL
jgi:hypothetical protein